MRLWLVGLMLAAQITAASGQAPTASPSEEPRLERYYYTAFFTEPWRHGRITGDICGRAAVVGLLAVAVHRVGRRRS